MDPPSILARSGGFVRSAWHHGGPTAPFIHVVTAFCFVLPKIFMEARLVDVGFLSQGQIRAMFCNLPGQIRKMFGSQSTFSLMLYLHRS